jgi:iron complex transport system substrate-binding protein
MSRQARRYPPNHGHAEEIFLMQPDLILAGGFTRRATTELLRRLGFRVETFYPAQSFTDIRANIARLGQLLARPVKTADVLRRFDTDLAKAQKSPAAGGKSAALYYANNYTSGSGTLAADIVARAGLTNIGTTLGLDGMVKLPLELLVVRAPDVIIAEQRDPGATALAYETFTHPALTATAARASAFIRTDSNWSCGAPFTIDAINSLVGATRETTGKSRSTNAPASSPTTGRLQ